LAASRRKRENGKISVGPGAIGSPSQRVGTRASFFLTIFKEISKNNNYIKLK
jgi:hypothetical protein